MDFYQFAEQLRTRLKKPLPGYKAQDRMAPFNRLPRDRWPASGSHTKTASVLILFYPREREPHLVFIKRPAYEGVHSRQIAFPGGATEADDKHQADTALRETKEEVGVAPQEVRLLGQLTNVYIPPSNYWVHPFVGVSTATLHFTPDLTEVEKVIEVPVNQLLNEEIIQQKQIDTREKQLIVPAFCLQGEVIWGATAMMLSELIDILKKTDLPAKR